MSIEELESYIQKNGHLPNIPTAAEATSEEGIGLAEMNAKLLEKVEELTLYIIEQEKKNIEQTENIYILTQKIQTILNSR